jgi:hypothetical protein
MDRDDPSDVIMQLDSAAMDRTIQDLEEQLLQWRTIRALRRVLEQREAPPRAPEALRQLVAATDGELRDVIHAHGLKMNRHGERLGRVMAYVTEQGGGPVTCPQIAAALDGNETATQQALQKLVALRSLVRVGYGQFQLADMSRLVKGSA